MAGAGGRPDAWWIPFTLGLVLLALAALFLAGVPQAAAQRRTLLERGVATDAVITAVHHHGRDLTADLAWRTTAGAQAQVRDLDVSGTLAVGVRVPVVYDPEDPSDVEVGDVGDGYLAVLWLGVLVAAGGTVAVLRGLWVLRGQVRT
ncbi:DUF3592 domain-containing protein [Quadrisphaera oryzae]|uniref:DUF3592 domain-containing protein n=1 Tax=Quadrisphaera TaxID=317661 RepID=UPI001648DB26|nr:DUF3592 domain-containing protein [Quadrisphaera sp. RL12-1S]MBC3762036.1 DUF3592 domain-containing protein [Quadrisphaera sp. RL12-1S]